MPRASRPRSNMARTCPSAFDRDGHGTRDHLLLKVRAACVVGLELSVIDKKPGCKLTSFVKHLLKFADVGHDGIKIGFLAKVHFSHFPVVSAEGLFEPGAGCKAESSLLSEFISRTALPEKVLLMLHDLLQQMEVLQRAKAAGMF